MSSSLRYLFIFLLAAFLAGCEAEEKTVQPEKPKKERTMKNDTGLSPSPETSLTIELDTTISRAGAERIFRDVFGINRIRTSRKKISLTYNPSVITADSIKTLLKQKKVRLARAE